ncbi:DEAD/DEAH box helicase [Variovorax sp. PCZ-1]|uniref:DEAD/DEAH box helicase n=1 Tax=Variovorax sp. PCZ-1 TaxID=2835533 RepID=UPI001BCD13C3|nr:DEAD/DEAH box helicase [Variovorax sp. PCZ-1]MBS7807873.1 DEAD/DEAH box helicase [Variovorax sp. PCZ-1]
MTFESLGLAPALLKAVTAEGYTNPTPVQAQAIPHVLAGTDLLAGAQTGTGKTAAFTLPLLHRLSFGRSVPNKFGNPGVRALILTPTRELAAQVEESIKTYGKFLQLKSAVIFGGVGMNPQIAQLRKGVDILVATPGRLLDLASQGVLDLQTVQMLVLDEADRMLDMGFIHDIRKILVLLPKQRQTLLFSATFSGEIRELAQSFLHNPQSIQVTPPNTTVQRITQSWSLVSRDKKKEALAHIIKSREWNQVLAFTRTKFGANDVAAYLEKQGISAMALHGNKSQSARTQALAEFKSGKLRALVATDIAARGIDIEELPHVVNYEIPNVSEDYVHRIGRTGRAGKDGFAISLVCLDEEGFLLDIEKFTKQRIPREDMPEFAPVQGEKAMPMAMGRQVLWGGAGKPPSREEMAAAGKAARREMMQRINTRKEGERAAGGGRGGNNGGGGGSRSGNAPARAPSRSPSHAPAHGARGHGGSGGGQPDPMRTGVDSFASRGRHPNGGGGNGGRGRSGGGSGGGGFGGNSNGNSFGRSSGNGGGGGNRNGGSDRGGFRSGR